MDQSEASESESDRQPSPSDCTITMPCSPSTLSSARPPRRLIVPVRPTPASGSRNPDGESGKRPFVTAVLLHAGGSRSRPLRFLALLPGHIHFENRLSDMAVVGERNQRMLGSSCSG
ncbi:hypothetical protein Zm00014a_012252 [Zea mays]|uniref:Uncharacterized protein n=1 Tax=Zea mays TaxID=4577 RepID=A0A3L6F351_MAIZE|nr:hypothetical protein Zm00014a_012252 [Zea mays]